MVLFKRKPVHVIPPPTDLADNVEIYEMKGTGEVFTDYEKYLKRYDYLTQKKFTDAVNGKSGLTYLDALESETRSSSAIENVFPEVLRDPILRRVQFSTISRVDDLVNTVFDEFKRDFFPGEKVFVLLENHDTMEGVIREKAKFPTIRGPDGSVQRAAFSRYFVRTSASRQAQAQEALLDDVHLRRDKKVFTKQNLRSFLKNSLQREGWIGAPWLVKEHLAIQYRLPMEIPAHLLQDAKLLAQKQQMLLNKAPRSRKSRPSGETVGQHQHTLPTHPGAPNGMQQYHAAQPPPVPVIEQRPLPPPPPRYPIEDLDIAPKCNGVTRPELKFFTEEMAEYVRSNRRTTFDDISMSSMGLLLEVWNTLNVQAEVYVLDSFTFDDFIDAMRYSSSSPECELLNEIHCAVLKQLVDAKGKLLVKGGMAEVVKEAEESSESVPDDSELSTPQPDVPARSTRSRLSHVDPAVENPRSPTFDKLHRATEMMAGRNWKERIAVRDFEDGGWQVVLIGLLYQLSFNSMFKIRCNDILAELAPLDADASQETARLQYNTLNINLRISALEMITMLSVSAEAVREFLESCSEDMTDVRKRKIEHQREKKVLFEELQVKDRERKILWPENMAESPKPESAEPAAAAGDIDDTLETNGAGSSDPDEDAAPGRSLRRANDRKRKRDEEKARRDKERVEKAEAAKAQSKQTKEFKKILNDIENLKGRIIELEGKIEECDADLREANVQRTKVLGQDRFCNRYYWFERNGQPFGGLPSSSTSDYGYANGRIWVQGPDEYEIGAFLGDPEQQREYKAKFRMTLPERRRQEEGGTILIDSREWGYYDDPDRLDNLIGWLDERGLREKKLRKELCDWRDKIVQYMTALKEFREREAANKAAADEEAANRITTRHKMAEDQTAALARCLRWENGMAREKNKHIHSEAPPKPREKKPPKQQKGVAMVVGGRAAGRMPTRQGGRYDFNK